MVAWPVLHGVVDLAPTALALIATGSLAWYSKVGSKMIPDTVLSWDEHVTFIFIEGWDFPIIVSVFSQSFQSG